MRRQLAAVTVLILAGGGVEAQPPKLIEAPPPKVMVESAGGLIRRLQDEVELLEAQVETKRAYTRAAEVGAESAKVKSNHVAHLAAKIPAVVSNDEVDIARLELDAAKALVEIRKAEQREVEVRLTHAKRRLDEAKGPPPVPAPPKLAK